MIAHQWNTLSQTCQKVCSTDGVSSNSRLYRVQGDLPSPGFKRRKLKKREPPNEGVEHWAQTMISRMAVGETPSPSLDCLNFLMAMHLPRLAACLLLAKNTSPYVPSPIFPISSYCCSHAGLLGPPPPPLLPLPPLTPSPMAVVFGAPPRGRSLHLPKPQSLSPRKTVLPESTTPASSQIWASKRAIPPTPSAPRTDPRFYSITPQQTAESTAGTSDRAVKKPPSNQEAPEVNPARARSGEWLLRAPHSASRSTPGPPPEDGCPVGVDVRATVDRRRGRPLRVAEPFHAPSPITDSLWRSGDGPDRGQNIYYHSEQVAGGFSLEEGKGPRWQRVSMSSPRREAARRRQRRPRPTRGENRGASGASSGRRSPMLPHLCPWVRWPSYAPPQEARAEL